MALTMNFDDEPNGNTSANAATSGRAVDPSKKAASAGYLVAMTSRLYDSRDAAFETC